MGKSNTGGLVEPISIVVKNNRRGLGREEVLRQVEQSKVEFRQRKLEEQRRRQEASVSSAIEFRAQKSKQRKLKQVKQPVAL